MNSSATNDGTHRRQSGVLIVRKFVRDEERLALAEWALSMRQYLDANGQGRTYLQTEELPFVPSVYTSLRKRLEKVLGVGSFDKEPMFGWYLSIISEGGAVHRHLDPPNDGMHHLRCNVFIQLPSAGGLPIVGGEVYQVQNGDMLAFFPSDRWHRSEKVEGNTERIILSFGYLAPSSYRLAPGDRDGLGGADPGERSPRGRTTAGASTSASAGLWSKHNDDAIQGNAG